MAGAATAVRHLPHGGIPAVAAPPGCEPRHTGDGAPGTAPIGGPIFIGIFVGGHARVMDRAVVVVPDNGLTIIAGSRSVGRFRRRRWGRIGSHGKVLRERENEGMVSVCGKLCGKCGKTCGKTRKTREAQTGKTCGSKCKFRGKTCGSKRNFGGRWCKTCREIDGTEK